MLPVLARWVTGVPAIDSTAFRLSHRPVVALFACPKPVRAQLIASAAPCLKLGLPSLPSEYMNSRAKRPRRVSQFVNDMAEVGGEGDEEDEQDEDDGQLLEDDDDGSTEDESLDIDIPLKPFSQRLDEDAREFGDWADGIGRLANKRAEQERVLRDQLAQSGNPAALSPINDLPDVRDPLMYCIRVKRGKETSLTFALMRKIIADTKNRYTQIYSIFSVPTVPDRIYIEALGMAPFYLLCTNMQGIYKDSWHAVSVLERVSILKGRVMPRKSTGICEDSIVKIRDGRYRDDHGYVVSVSESRKRFVVKLKSRETMPGELKRKKGRNAAFLLTKDTARNLGMKSVRQGHPSTPANANFEDLREGELESEARHLKPSFRFNGKTYTFDGHLLLDVAIDQVERVDSGPTCDSNVDNELILASNPVVHDNISEGHEVWVTDGEARGSCGCVVQLNFGGSALVEIQEHGPSSPSRSGVLLELSKRYLVRKLNIGDRVKVEIGIYVGVKGIIGSINTKQGYGNTVLGIVELSDDLPEDREVLVPVQFVDTIESLDDSIPIMRDEYVEGQHVIISKGKLQGKTGIVALIEKYHVRLLEDGTSCEMRVHKRSIRDYNEESNLQGMPARPPTPVKIEEVPLILCDGNDPIDVDALTDDDDYKCMIDHLAVGFVDSIVYVWRGIGKGKLARVMQAPGSVTKIQFDSALHGSSISFAKACNLLAQCSCTLDGGQPPWSKLQKKRVPLLFERIIDRPATPPAADRITSEFDPEPQYHDPNGEGMWLLDERIASIRKKYAFAVKIEVHRDHDVAGRRVGRVLPDIDPITLPRLKSLPVNVYVEYRNAEGHAIIEAMPASNLRAGQLKNKAKLAIIRGLHIGEVVIHARTDGPECRVHYEGTRSREAFRVPKSDVCVIECI